MGLFDRVRKKDYAEEFKKSFMDSDVKKNFSVFQDWSDSGSGDSNFYWASIIVGAATDALDLEDFKFLEKRANETSPVNRGLSDWFEKTAKAGFVVWSVKHKDD